MGPLSASLAFPSCNSRPEIFSFCHPGQRSGYNPRILQVPEIKKRISNLTQ